MKVKIQNAKRLKFILIVALFSSAVAVGLWQLTAASEASIQFTEHPSSSFGITVGQVARLNVVNSDPRERRVFVLRFLDDDGNILKTERATIEPKHTFGLLLPASEIGREGGETRTQIRAVVLMQGRRSNRLLGNVEVYDEATSKTSFGLLLPASDFDPQPEPPAPQ